MPVLNDFQIEITPEMLIGRQQLVGGKAAAGEAEAVCAAYAPLIAPAAAVAFFDCVVPEGSVGEAVFRSGAGENERVCVGTKIRHLRPAGSAAAVVYTIGIAAERQIARLKEAGNMATAALLGTYATMAAECVSNRTREYLERYAAERGWGVGPAMKPGSLKAWPLSGQRDLHRLTGAAEIGVSVSEESFLSPVFSGSFLIGLGPDYTDAKIKSLCYECDMFASCLWRSVN